MAARHLRDYVSEHSFRERPLSAITETSPSSLKSKSSGGFQRRMRSFITSLPKENTNKRTVSGPIDQAEGEPTSDTAPTQSRLPGSFLKFTGAKSTIDLKSFKNLPLKRSGSVRRAKSASSIQPKSQEQCEISPVFTKDFAQSFARGVHVEDSNLVDDQTAPERQFLQSDKIAKALGTRHQLNENTDSPGTDEKYVETEIIGIERNPKSATLDNREIEEHVFGMASKRECVEHWVTSGDRERYIRRAAVEIRKAKSAVLVRYEIYIAKLDDDQFARVVPDVLEASRLIVREAMSKKKEKPPLKKPEHLKEAIRRGMGLTIVEYELPFVIWDYCRVVRGQHATVDQEMVNQARYIVDRAEKVHRLREPGIEKHGSIAKEEERATESIKYLANREYVGTNHNSKLCGAESCG